MRALAFIVAAALASAPSIPASAQEGKALAEALFRDGRELLAAGKVREACGKFAMSQRIEPKLGTLLNLASCHETEGKTASAWAQFTEAAVIAARAGQPEREQYAREHADALAAKLSRVTIASAETSGISVRIDGVTVDAAVVGTAFPVDPGEHTVTVSAAGKQSWTTRITVPPGPATTSVSVPALDDAPAEPAKVEAIAAVPPAKPDAQPDAPAQQADRSADTRPVGWILLGAGAFGLGLGTFFGVRAFGKKADAEGHCDEGPDGLLCDADGDRLMDDSQTNAHASTVAFAAGLVAVGVGVYLLANKPANPAPPTGRRTAVPSFHGRGVSIAW